mgnify:CR=1 FL=1
MVCFWKYTSRQPSHSLEIFSNSDLIQRLAAPMPLTSDCVSDKVWRVPKLTNFLISFSIRSEEGAVAISVRTFEISLCENERVTVNMLIINIFNLYLNFISYLCDLDVFI